jgi:hypothetical protein
MKRIILVVVMSFVLISVGQIDFSYAGDFLKNVADLTETETDEDNATIVLAQANIEPVVEDVEVEEVEEEVEVEEPEPVEEEYEEIKE